MAWFFDKKTLGFLSTVVYGEPGAKGCSLPALTRLIAITDDEYSSLSDGMDKGLAVIVGLDGKPALKERSAHQDPTRQDIEILRIQAYSDKINGSDRLFSEASHMEVMGEIGFEEVRARAIARFEEIQAQYPWPAK